MDRRDFLKLSSATASATAVNILTPDLAIAAPEPLNNLKIVETEGFSILQGLTTETSTQLSIDVPKDMVVHYELMDLQTGHLMDPFYLKSVSRKTPKWRVDKIGFIDLPYLGKFVFRVLDDNGFVLDERNLGLLDLNKKDARIAFMSCMFDGSVNLDKIWSRVDEAKCDMYFFVGDNVYGDILLIFDGPNLLWNRYIETRRKLPFYHWKDLKPVLCTWDDHDYGVNNAKGNYKHKEASKETFEAFTAQEPIVDCFDRGPGISCFFKAFGQKFLLLDSRYFRKLAYDGITGFLGKEQIDWAFGKLAESNEPNWIIQGSQFFMDHNKKSETYANESPHELEVFTRKISFLNSPCAFVAGDIHYTEVCQMSKYKLGYETIEIASSSLHSAWKSTLPKNPTRIHGAAKENFVMVDLVPTRYDMVFDIQGIGIKKIWFDDRFGI